MKDDFDSHVRQMISEAEADIGFDRDPEPEPPLTALVQSMSAPGIAMMRAFWWPNWRK